MATKFYRREKRLLHNGQAPSLSGFNRPGFLIFLGDMDPIIQRESFKEFQNNNCLSELKESLQAEVVQLHALEQRALTEFYWENRPVNEIAKMMKLSHKSVEKLLDMAMTNIRKRFFKALGKPIPDT